MTETTTTTKSSQNFRRVALVLMIALIAFGVLELAGVVHM